MILNYFTPSLKKTRKKKFKTIDISFLLLKLAVEFFVRSMADALFPKVTLLFLLEMFSRKEFVEEKDLRTLFFGDTFTLQRLCILFCVTIVNFVTIYNLILPKYLR